MLDQVTAFLDVLIGQSGATHMSFGNVVMIVVGGALIAIAAAKRFEPFLLAGIGFACIIAERAGVSHRGLWRQRGAVPSGG